MADEPKSTTTNDAGNGGGSGNGDGGGQGGGDGGASADSKNTDTGSELKLTDEQFEQVFDDPRLFKHSRFKELSAKAKKVNEYEEAERKREEAEAKKRGDFEKLLGQKDEQIAKLTEQLDSGRKRDAVMAAASKAGAVDADAVARLIDSGKLETDDDGNVTNADQLVADLLKDKPYLTEKKPNAGSDTTTNASGQGEKPILKLSEIRMKSRDHNWYKENQKMIAEAEAEGRIDKNA